MIMEISENKKKIINIVLCSLFVLLSLVLIAFSIYRIVSTPVGTGMKYYKIWNIYIELAIYFAALVLCCLFEPKYRLIAALIIVTVFLFRCYMLVPIIAAIAYLVQIYLTGKVITTFINRKNTKINRSLESFLVGAVVNIVIVAILSLFHVAYWYVLAPVFGSLLIISAILERKVVINSVKNFKNFEISTNFYIAFSVILLCLFIHLGRANLTLDYDSVWYGLRSNFVLNPKGSIFDNLYLTGIVYTYPKGFEILTLVFSNSYSASFIYAFNICIAILVIYSTYKISINFIDKNKAIWISVLIATVPGIMNMSTTAKPDIIALLVEICMIISLVNYFKKKDQYYLFLGISFGIFSLCFKPTSIIFSGSILVAFLLVKLILKQKSEVNSSNRFVPLIVSILSFVIIIIRTWVLTGIPFSSIFADIFKSLNIELKYPYTYDGSNRPSYFLSASQVFNGDFFKNIANNFVNFFIAPTDPKFDHIIIVWGSVILLIVLILTLIKALFTRKDWKDNLKQPNNCFAFLLYLIEFGGAMLILLLGRKPDGNYFMLFYFIVYVFGGIYLTNLKTINKKAIKGALITVALVTNIFVTSVTNWAWIYEKVTNTDGGLVYNTKDVQKNVFERIEIKGIYDKITADPTTRVVGFVGFEFWTVPCIFEPVIDISYWGNADILHSAENFYQYLKYVNCDYILLDSDFLNENVGYKPVLNDLASYGCYGEKLTEKSYTLIELHYNK